MRSPTLLDELRELHGIIEQCAAQAAIAQQSAAKYIEHYRAQAEEFKRQAARTSSPEVRARLLRVAASHERLLKLAENREGFAEIAPEASEDYARPVDDLQEREGQERLRHRAAEDPFAQARRHVAQAEQHIARQESLVIRLSNNDKYAVLAAEAKEILATLKQTLSLARQHLELEQEK